MGQSFHARGNDQRHGFEGTVTIYHRLEAPS